MNKHAKRNGVLKAVTAVAFLSVLAVAYPSISAAFKNVQAGQEPPPFALKDLDGKEWKSEAFFGKGAAAVVFWATWSPRSTEVLRDLEALRAKIGPDKFQLVSVNCEHQTISAADRAAITGVVKQLGLTGPALVDEGLTTFNDYGAMALPSTLVVGGDAKVAYTLAGYPTTLREDLSDAVRKAAGLPTEAESRPVAEYVPKNHALMYYNLGRQLASKGQEEKAEAQLKLAVERDPDFKKPHVELGLIYKKTGRAALALEEFRRAKELDPKDHEALYQVAAVSLQAAKFDEAGRLFGELLVEFPEREELALGSALAAKYQGKQEDYLKARQAAEKLYHAEPRYIFELGSVAESQKDLPLAAELYRRALGEALAAK